MSWNIKNGRNKAVTEKSEVPNMTLKSDQTSEKDKKV